MDLFNITENFSNNLLTKIFVDTENPVGNFFNNIMFRLPDWTFILIATVISAIVAVKLEKKFENNKRIHTKKLVKEAFSESIFATGLVLFYGFLIFIGLGILYSMVKWGMKYSSTSTLLALVILCAIYFIRKRYKANKKATPLKRYRKKIK